MFGYRLFLSLCLFVMVSVTAYAAPPVQSVKWRDMEAWLVTDNSFGAGLSAFGYKFTELFSQMH